MKTKLSWRIAATAAIALLTVGVTSTPAQAYSFEWSRAEKTDGRWMNGSAYCAWKSYPSPGVGCFEGDGDYLQVGDLASDKKRVAVHWRTNYGRSGMCVSTGGHDATLSQNPLVIGERACNKNFKENRRVRFRVGSCNASKTNCNKVKNWGTWSAWTRWIKT